MIRYRMDLRERRPVPVECEERGYPHPDTEGRKQFDNSHFDTEPECWDALLAEAKAEVELDVRSIKEQRERLARSEAELASAAIALAEIEERRKAALEGPPLPAEEA